MVAKKFYSDQEAGNSEVSTLLQDSDEIEEEEEEEALSLCDLPIYSDSSSAQWDDFSKGQNSPFNNNDHDDLFEFFSEDLCTSTSATAENIIFCGKLIPFKDPPRVPQKSKNFDSNTQRSCLQNGDLLPWRPNSMDKAKPTSKTAKSSDSSFKKGQEAKGLKNNFLHNYSSARKVSLLRSNTKSRWYLFMFGMSRLSNEMELSDIRSRQSRRGPATMFPAPEHGEEVKSKDSRNIKYKGLWRKLRCLGSGCVSSKLANDVVKAAFV